MISSEIEKKILYFHAHERWNIGTIARTLRVHPETVRRVLAGAGLKKEATEPQRKSLVEPYFSFIKEELERHPRLTAARLFLMCQERGYKGGSDHFRTMVRRIRPEKRREAFARLETSMGEQGQVDWGSFGKISVPNGVRTLSCFVMVLSWSRAIYLEFFYEQTMSAFLEGHSHALEWFGGIPRILLYDNLKSVVLERVGNIIRFNPNFMEYANEIGFEPRPVAVRRGNEKGRVERAIRYIRDNFFAGRSFKSIEDLNEQARIWRENTSLERKHQGSINMTVKQAFEIEQPTLRRLPAQMPLTFETFLTKVPKVPEIRIDGNDYAVPGDYVYKQVQVRLSQRKVIVDYADNKVAEHTRSWEKRRFIDEQGFMKQVVESKGKAFEDGTKSRLLRMLPNLELFLIGAKEERFSLGSIVAAIDRLVDSYGPQMVDKALKEALQNAQFHSGSITLILEREKQGQVVPLPLILPKSLQSKKSFVKPHAIETYNALREACHEK
jgi:transposase